jgi:hypothetical protein
LVTGHWSLVSCPLPLVRMDEPTINDQRPRMTTDK